jgi:hypothetical protein
MMKDSKTAFFCSKILWARERISPKIIDNLGTRSQKGPPALPHTVFHISIAYFSDKRTKLHILLGNTQNNFGLSLYS